MFRRISYDNLDSGMVFDSFGERCIINDKLDGGRRLLGSLCAGRLLFDR